MNSNEKMYIIVIALLLIVITLMFFILAVKIGQEGNQCLTDPFVFEASRLEKANGKELQCSCILLTEQASQTLHFNSTERWFTSPQTTLPSRYDRELDVSVIEGLLNMS